MIVPDVALGILYCVGEHKLDNDVFQVLGHTRLNLPSPEDVH